MTLYEGIILLNLTILLYTLYTLGKIKTELETVYEGLALVMTDHEKLKEMQ